jgi:hypothetical protein
MKHISNAQKIRERILSNSYGRFDLVEDILTKEEILNWKPRIVLKNITDRLSLSADKINRKTFWSWLRRYRQHNSPVSSHLGGIKPRNSSNGNPLDPPIKGITKAEWLEDFKVSVPKSESQTPVMIKVIRSGNNSHEQNLKK